jgi:threonine/homoserine/homoserine lactone efflux protein
MHLTVVFFTVALAHFIALLSPGPDFLLVVKSGVRNDKRSALGVALGIACANAFYIALCLIGVGAILAASVTAMIVLKIVGGLFLTYLAVMALKARKQDYDFLERVSTQPEGVKSSFGREFLTGLASGIFNPKNPLFYVSLFTLVLNKDVGIGFKIALGAWMVAVVFLWDAAIIFVLSRQKVRSVFNGAAFYIDKVAALILGAIGFTMVRSALVQCNK